MTTTYGVPLDRYTDNAYHLLVGAVEHLVATGRKPVYLAAFKRYTNSNAVGFHLADEHGRSLYPMLIDLNDNPADKIRLLLTCFGTPLAAEDQPHWRSLLPFEFQDSVPDWCHFQAVTLNGVSA